MSLKILNALFDAVYVLYLPRHDRRRERLAAQLAGVNVEWVQGVDAAEHKVKDLRARVTELAGPNCEPINPKIRPKNMAIWLGQYEVRERIRAAGQRALVLEDDAWFVPDAQRRLEHYFHELLGEPINGNWHLLYLYRENPAGAIDAATRRAWGGTEFPGGWRPAMPVFSEQARRDGKYPLWDFLVAGKGESDQVSYPRELVQRSDGSVLDHVYRGSYERISTAAYAISATAVDSMYTTGTHGNVIWTNDYWVGRLTEHWHPLRSSCYCLTPSVCWPREVW
jgi:hypothetical protein